MQTDCSRWSVPNVHRLYLISCEAIQTTFIRKNDDSRDDEHKANAPTLEKSTKITDLLRVFSVRAFSVVCHSIHVFIGMACVPAKAHTSECPFNLSNLHCLCASFCTFYYRIHLFPCFRFVWCSNTYCRDLNRLFCTKCCLIAFMQRRFFARARFFFFDLCWYRAVLFAKSDLAVRRYATKWQLDAARVNKGMAKKPNASA